MGLNHPEDIELWREWERSRHRSARAVHAASALAGRVLRRDTRSEDPGAAPGSGAPESTGTPEARWVLRSRDGERRERILLALDASTAPARAAVLSFLPYLRLGVDVLAPVGLEPPEIADGTWRRQEAGTAQELIERADPAGVLSLGQDRGGGDAAHRHAERTGRRSFVVQHGVLSPFAPPVPRATTVLAWSDADAAFWTEGRRDVETRAVGSQLLWQAGHESVDPQALDPGVRPVFLGDLRTPGLSRRVCAAAAYGFCRTHEAAYRPHPSETDAVSRAFHRTLRARGIEVGPSDVPLRDVAAPVVGIASTGVLEAAARGLPAWVHCPGAPGWLHELWLRYGMRRIGGEPTPAPEVPAGEPAAEIAKILEEAL